jgi:hypothetical protein
VAICRAAKAITDDSDMGEMLSGGGRIKERRMKVCGYATKQQQQ